MQFHTKCCGRTSPSSPQPIVCLLLRAQFRGQRLSGPRSFPPKLALSPSRKGTNSGVSSGIIGGERGERMISHETSTWSVLKLPGAGTVGLQWHVGARYTVRGEGPQTCMFRVLLGGSEVADSWLSLIWQLSYLNAPRPQ
ncbi:hypothetical protein CGRA01v4_09540 [Colletotrichum graminicola]|nr:hypothetical protein CGRA01v4_09540 [Colletotrichum graminicola]